MISDRVKKKRDLSALREGGGGKKSIKHEVEGCLSVNFHNSIYSNTRILQVHQFIFFNKNADRFASCLRKSLHHSANSDVLITTVKSIEWNSQKALTGPDRS